MAADLKKRIYAWLVMTAIQYGPTALISGAVVQSARRHGLMGLFSTMQILPAWIWKEHR
jgi:hypothetical protein